MEKSVKVKLLSLGYTKAVPITKLLTDEQKKWDKIIAKTLTSNKNSITIRISPLTGE